jgi:hypothetical protein
MYCTILVAYRNNESDHTDCTIITIEGGKKLFGWVDQIVHNILKFKRN